RLRQLSQAQPVAAPSNIRLLLNQPTNAARRLARWVPASPKKVRKLAPRLAAAGYPGQSAVVFFSATQLVSALLVGVGALAILGLTWWRVAAVLSVAG